MNAESKNVALLFDGNPCAEEVDWSGLGVDRLPARMVGDGYHNGNFSSSLRVLKMGRNKLDESVFGELVAANFTNIEELDVSRNALGGIEEDVRALKKLTKLDVSGNEGISAA
jgi:Leucine-rich repeat (LRR) protein